MTTIESLQFIEFGVVIRAEDVNTRLINETNLRRFQIIREEDEAELDSTIVTPFHSIIEFNNGLEISADQSRLHFRQRGEFSTSEENRCCEIATSFLEKLKVRIPFNSISIKFKAVIPHSTANGESNNTARFFADRASWANWRGILPNLHFKAMYREEDMTTTLWIGTAMKGDDESTTAELYEIDFHRYLGDDDLELKYSKVIDTLEGWFTDLTEFQDLVSNFRQV